MGARELGNALGNPLARPRGTQAPPTPITDPVIVDIVPNTTQLIGTYTVDKSYRYFRVTLVGGGGAGGSGSVSAGGGGGGLAQSAIIATRGASVDISYAICAQSLATAVDSTAAFLDVALFAGGGKAPSGSPGGAGGQGSGGAKNFNGGAGGSISSSQKGCGGGSAGLSANGGNGPFGADYNTFSAEPGGFAGTGGVRLSASDPGGGGAGFGASYNNNTGAGSSPPKNNGNGGAWGGGGAGNATGGQGAMRIELW